MKYCRFNGLIQEARSHGLAASAALMQPRCARVEEREGEYFLVEQIPEPPQAYGMPVVQSARKMSLPVPLDAVRVLPPVTPSKIVCVGRNYRDHAKELGNEVPAEPLIFLKPPSTLIASGETIVLPLDVLPPGFQRVDFEGELGIVIEKRCHKLKEGEDPKPFIRGYVVANDVTAREVQKPDGQWTRAKGFDTFCPVGPILSNEIDPFAGVEVSTYVNGEQRQHASTSDFLFGIDRVLRYISSVMTLEPGDLILTGTPSGVGPLKHGDVVEVKIAGLATLRNEVRSAEVR